MRRAVLAPVLAGALVLVACGSPAGTTMTPEAVTPLVASSRAVRVSKVGTGTSLAGCPVFPADNAWNTDISQAPVRAGSAATIARLGGNLHPDFGSNLSYGIPVTIVAADQAPVPVQFNAYGSQSDPGPYPIPLDAPIESGSDAHVLALQEGTCVLYELFAASSANGVWTAASGARWDLRSNALRPEGWTSADAAGLAILPGLVRYDEVASGQITHALRMTFSETYAGHIHPATHDASANTDPALPPMGLRMRLRADFDISGYTGAARVILVAMQHYGVIVADNGSNWFFGGTSDQRWNDDDLDQLKGVPGNAFEVVDTGPVIS